MLGVVHAELSEDWLNAVVHRSGWWPAPCWSVAWALAGAAHRPCLAKRSLAQVFVLVACALLAVGIARMLAVPVFLTLFLMGVLPSRLRPAADPALYRVARRPLAARHRAFRHRRRASLPWQEFTWLAGLQALGLLLVRAAAKAAGRWPGPAAACPCQAAAGRHGHPALPPRPCSWPSNWPACIRKWAVRP